MSTSKISTNLTYKMMNRDTEKNTAQKCKGKLAEILRPQIRENSLLTVLVLLFLVASLILVLVVLFGLYLSQFEQHVAQNGIAKKGIANGSGHLKVNLEEEPNQEIQPASPILRKVVNEGENTANESDVVEEEEDEEENKMFKALAKQAFMSLSREESPDELPRKAESEFEAQAALFKHQFNRLSSDIFYCPNFLAKNCSSEPVKARVGSIYKELIQIGIDFVTSYRSVDNDLAFIHTHIAQLNKLKQNFASKPVDLCESALDGAECLECIRKNAYCYKKVTGLWGRP